MCFPSFVDNSIFAVKASLNPAALFTVSLVALLANMAVFVYHFAKVFKYRRSPVRAEVHPDLGVFKVLAGER